MAALFGASDGTRLSLTPYKMSEIGPPTWILATIEFAYEGSVLMDTSISLTSDDLEALVDQLKRMEGADAGELHFVSTDADLALDIVESERPNHLQVSVWHGEYYGLMRGFRFLSKRQELDSFATQLRADTTRSYATEPGHLP
jgi:hypothetical protein